MGETTETFTYKLLELYRYEDLKIKLSNLSSELLTSLNNGDLNNVVNKNEHMDKALKTVFS